MKKFILFLLISFVLYGSSASKVRLREILEEARENNPEIQAFKSQYEASQSRTSPFLNLMDPMIEIEKSSDDMKMYSLTQNFPFPTKLSSESNLARAEAEMYKNAFLEKEQEVLNEVKKSYAHLFFLHKKYQVVNESRAFFEQLFNIALRNYSIGKTTQVDMLRAQVELSEAENELLRTKDEISIEETRLNILLNREINSPMGFPEEVNTNAVNIPLEELLKIAEENEPGLRASLWFSETAKKMKSLEKQSYLPDLSLKFTQEELSGGMTNRKYMVGFSIPIYFWGKQNEKVKEAEANIKLAEAEYKAVKNKILLEVKESKIYIDNYNRTQALYKNTVIPQAKASLNSALTAYEANQIDFLGLLDSERALISFEMKYYEAISELYKAIADLEKAVGLNLTKEKEE